MPDECSSVNLLRGSVDGLPAGISCRLARPPDYPRNVRRGTTVILRAFDLRGGAAIRGQPKPYDFTTNVWKQALKGRDANILRPRSIAGILCWILPKQVISDFVCAATSQGMECQLVALSRAQTIVAVDRGATHIVGPSQLVEASALQRGIGAAQWQHTGFAPQSMHANFGRQTYM